MAADRGALPGVLYPEGTMAIADLYPTHVGIGGVTTQNRALPAFAEATSAAANRAGSLSNPEGLIGSPAGYLALILGALVVGSWLIRD